MANKHLLQMEPYDVEILPGFPQAWWYEGPAGIEVYRSNTGLGMENLWVLNRVGLIRWPAIRRALARKDKK